MGYTVFAIVRDKKGIRRFLTVSTDFQFEYEAEQARKGMETDVERSGMECIYSAYAKDPRIIGMWRDAVRSANEDRNKRGKYDLHWVRVKSGHYRLSNGNYDVIRTATGWSVFRHDLWNGKDVQIAGNIPTCETAKDIARLHHDKAQIEAVSRLGKD